MNNSRDLINRSKRLLAIAETIQDETKTLEECQKQLDELSELYHEWYRSGLALFDAHKQPASRQKFEQEYEGSFWNAKIIKFLTLGLQINSLYDPKTAVINKWTYPFTRCFKEPLLKQCNILANLENSSVLSIQGRNESDLWNVIIRRIFTVFIEKAEFAKTNHEKKLTYEYLAVFLIGAVNGLTVIGHDKRGASEEIDLWVSNASDDSFWQRHVGDPFIVECKNWMDPVGVTEIRKLLSIMEDKKVQFALLLAKNGVTGTKYQDAIRLMQNAVKDRRYIIVLNYDDLLEIASKLHPSDKIKKKFYSLIME